MIDFSKIWFASFSDSRMRGALKRLGRQAKKFGFFKDHICLFTENELEDEFRTKFSSHLILGSRGYGYWCWKPQIVLQMFKIMEEDDILLYLDAGCHLNQKGIVRFENYINSARKDTILGFQSYSLMGDQEPNIKHHIRLERELTKGDIFDFFHVREIKRITETAQFLGGVFFVKKTQENIQFFKKYQSIFQEHWNLVDDSPSVSANLPGFWTNRHDQSIFSIMMKLRNAKSYSSFECEHLLHHAPEAFKNNRQWGRASFEEMLEFPIHARRDKTSNILAYIPISIRARCRKFCRETYYSLKNFLLR